MNGISRETREHLTAVAAHLTSIDGGNQWRLVVNPECGWLVCLVRPNHDEELLVQLETRTYNGPVVKYTVSGSEPTKYKDFNSYDHQKPKASLNPARPAQDIAKDIARRVLPGYREDMADFEQRLQRQNTFLDKRDRLNARMARAAGLATPEPGKKEFGIRFRNSKGYTPSIEVETYVHTTDGDYEQVSVHFDHMPADVAEKLLTLAKTLTSGK